MSKRGRNKKVRYIEQMPHVAQFSPRGKAGRPDEIDLRLDHFEAIKLADHQGLDQTQAAQAMKISRTTFGRILREARKIIANAIINGKAIKIGMGDTQVGVKNIHNHQKESNDTPPQRIKKDSNAQIEEIARKNILNFHQTTPQQLPT